MIDRDKEKDSYKKEKDLDRKENDRNQNKCIVFAKDAF